MDQNKRTIFGFDLGTNSIGWAVLEEDTNGNPSALIDMGSRIFQKAVEDKTPTPKNLKRRMARLARRINGSISLCQSALELKPAIKGF